MSSESHFELCSAAIVDPKSLSFPTPIAIDAAGLVGKSLVDGNRFDRPVEHPALAPPVLALQCHPARVLHSRRQSAKAQAQNDECGGFEKY